MKKYHRKLKERVEGYLTYFPVVAILGPRQCGKTTLAREIAKKYKGSIYLDLERMADLQKLKDPELYFQAYKGKLIVIDEIQQRKDLFPAIRSFVDMTERTSPLLILGSASPELIRQSTETLAGRIAYCELSPLTCIEVEDRLITEQWLRGGFPDSLRAPDDNMSFDWREFYFRTLTERDLPLLGLTLSPLHTHRLFSILAHSQGELVNLSKLGSALGVSHTAFRQYLDFMESSYLVRTLQPLETNTKKRLIKTPKVYIRDSGIYHLARKIRTFDDLLGSDVVGNSWEGFAIEQILSSIDSSWDATFYRTQAGAEMDLVIDNGKKRIAIEFKANTAPSVTKGFWQSIDDIKPDSVWIVSPVNEAYPYAAEKGVMTGGVREVITAICQE